jgi:hypothetical protein
MHFAVCFPAFLGRGCLSDSDSRDADFEDSELLGHAYTAVACKHSAVSFEAVNVIGMTSSCKKNSSLVIFLEVFFFNALLTDLS